ncbi:NAD(P)H-dependent oxidoreductase subunit E [bacterium]|nr:NAD(P)H-dependent oxidoreductase subunit E [bacterium]
MECRTSQLKDAVDIFVDKHGNGRENLLAMLQDVVKKFGYVSGAALIEISRVMDISIGEIHGVATFYSFINTTKKGTNVIRVCQSVSCDMADKNRLIRILERETGTKMGETDEDGLFTLEYTNCMGMCDKGPAMMINNDIYASLTAEGVADIIDKYRGK